jgi:hypothetical protein
MKIGVSIEPDESNALSAIVKCARNSCNGTSGERVVAAESKRDEPFSHCAFGFVGELAADIDDCCEIRAAPASRDEIFPASYCEVPGVINFMTERRQSFTQLCNTQSGRSHVHAAAAGAKIERNSDRAYSCHALRIRYRARNV